MATRENPLRDLQRIVELGQQLTSFTDLDQLLSHIVLAVKDLCDCEEASILLLDKESNQLSFRSVSGSLGEVLHQVHLPFNDRSIAGWALLNRRSQMVEKPQSDPHFDREVDEMTNFVTHNILAVPILWRNEAMGVIEALNKLDGPFNEQDEFYLQILAAHSGIALHQSYQLSDWHNYFMYSTELLTAAIEANDAISSGHFDRVARKAGKLARKMGLNGSELEDIIYAAHFHDVGKIVTGHPVTGMKDFEHPAKGAAIVANIHMLHRIAPFIHHHHERWDGSGFPDGLIGDASPMGARILALAESYDEEWIRRDSDESPSVFNEKFFRHAEGKHDPKLLLALHEILATGHAD